MSETLVRLGILESYGVRWTPEALARDVLQNFFDSTPDFGDVTVDVDRTSGTVFVHGPTPFDMELLYYIGATTKHDDHSAGGFGEGFKVCALVGTRDMGLRITAGTGTTRLEVTYHDVSVGRELCYRVENDAESVAGSWVRLENCPADVLDAFGLALNMFRWAGNTDIGPIIAGTPDGSVALAQSKRNQWGQIYYRRQLRGKIRFWRLTGEYRPVTILYDPPLDEIEGDRDRRDVPLKPLAIALGQQLPPEELHRILVYLEAYWEYGNELLNGLLVGAQNRNLVFGWPSHWLARFYPDPGNLCDLARRNGFQLALQWFAKLGMPTVTERYSGDLETRPPTPLEHARLRVVWELYRDILKREPRTSRFEVFDSDRAAVMGQHLGDRLLVGSHLIAQGFDSVAGTVLHELGHDAGGETDIRFHKRLSRVLEGLLKNPERTAESRARYTIVTESDAPVEQPPQEVKPPVVVKAPTYESESAKGWVRFSDPIRGNINKGYVIVLCIPLRYPLERAILEQIATAAKDLDFTYHVFSDYIRCQADAEKMRIPGVPWIRVAGIDVGTDDNPPMYRLRTWDGHLIPPVEMIKDAMRAAAKRGNPSKSMDYELLREAPREPKAVDPKVEVRLLLHNWASPFGYGTEATWQSGLYHAAKAVLDRYVIDNQTPEEATKTIRQIVTPGIELARKLRVNDTTFDIGDPLDVLAMSMAQGLTVTVYHEHSDTGDPDRATAFFRQFRGFTNTLMNTHIPDDVRKYCLTSVFKRVVGLDGYGIVGNWKTPLLCDEFETISQQELNSTLRQCEQFDHDDLPLYKWARQLEVLDIERKAKMAAEKPAPPVSPVVNTDVPSESDILRLWDDTMANTHDPLVATQALMDITEKK